MSDRERRYQDALRAAVKAKNPWLAASIRAAMRGEEYDPFQDLSIHPEIDDHKFLKPYTYTPPLALPPAGVSP